ncbi:MAG: gliding motility-associated C-terminal domain-containing protein, partial [Chitinophagaceae bacterium]|nr:gliding motility-associated C-terminal domain-containing protein [Chitinophagaceae bacterium]
AISAGKHYKWVPAAGVSNPDISNPVITPAGNIGDKITYQVTATDTNGCKGEGYVHIRIHKGPAVYLPNAFTPNGDGKNDIFIPHYVGIKQIHQFKVFNRWGQEVFSTRNLQDGWDGNRLGLPQPSGTYVWMVEAVTSDNQKIFRKGIVTLIR